MKGEDGVEGNIVVIEWIACTRSQVSCKVLQALEETPDAAARDNGERQVIV